MNTAEDVSLPMLPTKRDRFSKSSTGTPKNWKEANPKLWAGLRENPRVSLYCLALTSAILLWGYDMAMSGNVYGMDEFMKDYGKFNESEDEWSIPSQWLSLWSMSSPLGAMLGSVTGGWLQDRFGRRLSLGLGSLTSAIGVAIIFASAYASSGRQVIFMLGKFVQGLTIGVVVTTTQTYISEVLPSTLRGPLLAFFPIFFLIGQLVSALIVLGLQTTTGRMAYLTAIISEWPFSAIPVVIAISMPESPTYLLRNGRFADAIKAQKRLDSPHMDSHAKIDELRQIVAQEEQKAAGSASATYLDCFKNTDFRRTGIAMFGAVLPQLFGLPILGDGPYFLQKAGMDSQPSFVFLVTGVCCGIIGTVISMWLLSFIGRRTLILFTTFPLITLWLGMGIAGSIESEASAWVVGVITNLVPLIAALGVWPASYVITGEVSSLRLKAKTTGIAWAVGGASNLFFSMVTPYIYNDDAGDLGAKIAYIWVAICGATFVAEWFIVPEMLGRTTIQIDQMFEEEVPARHFSSWVAEPLLTNKESLKATYKVGPTESNRLGENDSNLELDWIAPQPREFG